MRPPRRQMPPLTQGLAVDVFLQREHLKSAADREAAGQSARSKKLQGDSGDADAEQDFRLTLGLLIIHNVKTKIPLAIRFPQAAGSSLRVAAIALFEPKAKSRLRSYSR